MPIQSNCACPPENEISLLKKINNNIAVLNDTVGSGGGGVSSITGTGGQVLANGLTTAQTGAVTLSIPSAVTGVASIAPAIGNNSLTLSPTGTGPLLSTGTLNAFNVAAGVTPFAELEVDSTLTTSPRGIMSAQFSTGTDGARFHLRKARGTRAIPTTVVTGDNLGRLVATGYDGSNYLEDASIIFGTEGTIAATRIATNIQFWTATNAAPSVLTEAGRFDSGQNLVLTKALAAIYGGTGQTSFTTGDILYASSSTALSKLAASTVNYVLTSGGAGVAPSWAPVSGAGLGNFSGPGPTVTDNAIVLFNGTGGLTGKQSVVTITSGAVAGVTTLTTSGAVTIGSGAGGATQLLSYTNTSSTSYGMFGRAGSTQASGQYLAQFTSYDAAANVLIYSDTMSLGGLAATVATSVGTGVFKSAGFGFSNTSGGASFVGGNFTAGGNLIAVGVRIVSTDTLSGAGAVSVTKDTTKFTSTGVGDALTLANGTDGQIKRIIHDVDGGSGILTPATKTGYTTVTFTNAGDSVTLEYVTTRGWIVVGSFGVTIS